MVVGRKKPLNIALILLSVLQAWIKVASAQDNRTSSNITVTRNLVLPDFFDFWSNTRNEECSVSTPTICEDYGGIAGHVDCKEICCKRCICQRQKPTFVVDKQQCVEDRNITGISGPTDHFFLNSVAGISCTSVTVLPTLDVSVAGKQSFTICLNGVKLSRGEVDTCSVLPKKHLYVGRKDLWVGWNDSVARQQLENSFQVNNKLELKWTGLSSLQGAIVSVAVKCCIKKFIGPRLDEFDLESSLFFKIAGSQIWPGPNNVFDHKYVVMSTPNPVTSSSVVMTTHSGSSTMDYESKLNIVHVPGNVDLLLVIVAAVLGSLLVLVVAVAAGITSVVLIRRKQKLNISGKRGASNPTYERGPDKTLLTNGRTHQASLNKAHFYQPLVENTRMPSRDGKDPIYESLDDHLRESRISLTENPNRCSLAYCDVTPDGYLVPIGEPPIDNIVQSTRPRFSSSYDEPEVMIADRTPPKLKVEMICDEEEQNEEIPKPFYHVLEEGIEEAIEEGQQHNKTVPDNCKSPTENSYLELIYDETNAPLESEML